MQVVCLVSVVNQAAGQAVVFDAALVFDVILRVCLYVYEIQPAVPASVSLASTAHNIRESLGGGGSNSPSIHPSIMLSGGGQPQGPDLLETLYRQRLTRGAGTATAAFKEIH